MCIFFPKFGVRDDSWTNRALKYAHWTGIVWVKEIVEEGFSEEVGETSIVVDHGGYPHISYGTYSAGSLHYAFMTASFPWHLFLPAVLQD